MHPAERFLTQEYLAVVAEGKRHPGRCLLHAEAEQGIRKHAANGYPAEVCGLLIGCIRGDDWIVDEAKAVENLNRSRAHDRFELDPDAYRKIDRTLKGSGRAIIGVYHSHPDCPAKPSPTDLAAAWPGYAYIIASVSSSGVTDLSCWALCEEESRFVRVPVEISA